MIFLIHQEMKSNSKEILLFYLNRRVKLSKGLLNPIDFSNTNLQGECLYSSSFKTHVADEVFYRFFYKNKEITQIKEESSKICENSDFSSLNNSSFSSLQISVIHPRGFTETPDSSRYLYFPTPQQGSNLVKQSNLLSRESVQLKNKKIQLKNFSREESGKKETPKNQIEDNNRLMVLSESRKEQKPQKVIIPPKTEVKRKVNKFLTSDVSQNHSFSARKFINKMKVIQ